MSAERILIIEDNPKNLKLIRDILQYRGYETLEAQTAESGMDLARKHAPDLILMDVQLPGMDGCSAMKTLKEDAGTRHIPIIALTAFSMKGDRERLLAEGFDDYMAKPIDLKNVYKTVEKYLGRPPK